LSERRRDHDCKNLEEYGFIASVTGMCEAWRFEGLTNDDHTARIRFRNTFKPNYSIKNIAYFLVECRIITRCTGVGKARSRMAGVDWDPTHYTTTRLDILSGSTCSAQSIQKGGALLQRWAYRKENRKHYQIVNGCRTTSDPPDVPHDFLPFQTYSIFHRRDNKCSERKR